MNACVVWISHRARVPPRSGASLPARRPPPLHENTRLTFASPEDCVGGLAGPEKQRFGSVYPMHRRLLLKAQLCSAHIGLSRHLDIMYVGHPDSLLTNSMLRWLA
jgi:hypothetical protein